MVDSTPLRLAFRRPLASCGRCARVRECCRRLGAAPDSPTLQERFGLSGVADGPSALGGNGGDAGGVGADRTARRANRLGTASAWRVLRCLPASLMVLGLAEGLATLVAGRRTVRAQLRNPVDGRSRGRGRRGPRLGGDGPADRAAGAGWLVGHGLSGVVDRSVELQGRFRRDRAPDAATGGRAGPNARRGDTSAGARLRQALSAARSERALGGAMLVTALLGAVAESAVCSRRWFSPTTVSRRGRSAP